MNKCSPCRVAEERFRNDGPTLLVSFPALDLCRLPLRVVRAFQLVVPRGLAKQLLNVRRRVVRRCCVHAGDTVIAVELITRSEFETRYAFRIDGDQVQPIGLARRCEAQAGKVKRVTDMSGT